MTRPLILRIKRHHPAARLPAKAHGDDAGFDVFAPRDVSIFGNRAPVVVALGFSVELPMGYGAVLVARSSRAADGIVILGSLIDPGYRGVWKAVVGKIGDGRESILAGEKLCQFILLPVPRVEVVEVNDLAGSARGAGGFGSTGK